MELFVGMVICLALAFFYIQDQERRHNCHDPKWVAHEEKVDIQAAQENWLAGKVYAWELSKPGRKELMHEVQQWTLITVGIVFVGLVVKRMFF